MEGRVEARKENSERKTTPMTDVIQLHRRREAKGKNEETPATHTSINPCGSPTICVRFMRVMSLWVGASISSQDEGIG
jgi:hypothetical protein